MLALYTRISTEIRTRLSREEEGATAVEYGLIVGVIAVALIAALALLGPQVAGLFESVTNGITPGGTGGVVTGGSSSTD